MDLEGMMEGWWGSGWSWREGSLRMGLQRGHVRVNYRGGGGSRERWWRGVVKAGFPGGVRVDRGDSRGVLGRMGRFERGIGVGLGGGMGFLLSAWGGYPGGEGGSGAS